MVEQIVLYKNSEINRTVPVVLIQENLFLENNLSKNIFPNSELIFEKNYHVLKPYAVNLTKCIVDELLHICCSLISPIYQNEGDGDTILYSHCSFDNNKFFYLDEENLSKLEFLLKNNTKSCVEIYFYFFDDYKEMVSKVLRYIQNESDTEDKFDIFFLRSL